MGKPTGYIEYDRETPPARPPQERIHDYHEFHLDAPEESLRTQAARCMDCGIPFCHTGAIIGGMASGCPLNNLIPEWNNLVYTGRWRDAYNRLRKTNNFPEFTGRVCPAPCEGSCTVGMIGDPVTIKSLELAIVERAWEEGWMVPEPPLVRTGKRVAVVGSGPAGLACAAQLNKAGHLVTVFERADRIGGLLMYGIPTMKLDKAIVDRRVDLLAEEGITFITNTEVGRDIGADQMRHAYDAVVLCTGATQPRDLPIEGRELAGIHFAVDFLRLNTRSLLDSSHRDGRYISAVDKDVIVIGGGDTGTDCVATALRHGCRSIRQLEILPCLPKVRQADNPWPEWPKIYRLDYGQEEAEARFGREPREYGILTKRFAGDENSQVCALHTVRVEQARAANGRPVFNELPGTEQVWPAQLVLLALGFLGPENGLLQQFGVRQDERSNIQTARGKFATNLPNIFAAGDAHRGQSLIAWAIHEGRAAARECDNYLMGSRYLS